MDPNNQGRVWNNHQEESGRASAGRGNQHMPPGFGVNLNRANTINNYVRVDAPRNSYGGTDGAAQFMQQLNPPVRGPLPTFGSIGGPTPQGYSRTNPTPLTAEQSQALVGGSGQWNDDANSSANSRTYSPSTKTVRGPQGFLPESHGTSGTSTATATPMPPQQRIYGSAGQQPHNVNASAPTPSMAGGSGAYRRIGSSYVMTGEEGPRLDPLGYIESAFRPQRAIPRGIPNNQPRYELPNELPPQVLMRAGQFVDNLGASGFRPEVRKQTSPSRIPKAINPNFQANPSESSYRRIGQVDGGIPLLNRGGPIRFGQETLGTGSHQHSREPSHGSNFSMAEMTPQHKDGIIYGSMNSMNLTQGQNPGANNEDQSNRQSSWGSGNTERDPASNMTKDDTARLEDETMGNIRYLRENEDQSEVYLAFYGHWTDRANANRELLHQIEGALDHLGIFRGTGLMGIFPILKQHPEYASQPQKVRLADWSNGSPNYDIPRPLEQNPGDNSRSFDAHTLDHYHQMMADGYNSGAVIQKADNPTHTALGNGMDEFKPSYMVNGGRRPPVSSILLYQAALAGIDLQTCKYKGSISARMVKNALTAYDDNCAVFIKAVGAWVADWEVFQTIDDPVFAYFRKDPIENRHPNCAVTITFMDRAAAERYMDKATFGRGIELGGHRLKIVWSKDPAAPAEPYERLQSRVLTITGPSEDPVMGLNEIKTFLEGNLSFSLVYEEQFHVAPTTTQINLHFQSIRGQSRQSKACLEKALRKAGRSDITVGYGVDPCSLRSVTHPQPALDPSVPSWTSSRVV